jgi:hypothetical protein
MVQSQCGRATIFCVVVDGREYWVTAKHVLTGAEHPPYGSVRSKSVLLQLLNPSAVGKEWIPEKFSVIDTGGNIDIVVLAPLSPILSHRIPTEPMDSSGVDIGGDCEFLGFPFGGSWRARFATGQTFWMPFSKHCTVLAFYNIGTKVWILDGINNEGFSGGPVVVQTGPAQKIVAVISGYWQEPAEVISSLSAQPQASNRARPTKPSTAKKPYVNVNSGFIVAYDIKCALDAIRKDPIGPLCKLQGSP